MAHTASTLAAVADQANAKQALLDAAHNDQAAAERQVVTAILDRIIKPSFRALSQRLDVYAASDERPKSMALVVVMDKKEEIRGNDSQGRPDPSADVVISGFSVVMRADGSFARITHGGIAKTCWANKRTWHRMDITPLTDDAAITTLCEGMSGYDSWIERIAQRLNSVANGLAEKTAAKMRIKTERLRAVAALI